jgi:hypothetical protein
MSSFYVYELWNPIKNEIFYVGKSQHKSRSTRLNDHLKEAQEVLTKKRMGTHKTHTILKILREGYNIDFKIVYETINEQEAFEKEKALIRHYGRRDLKTGPLTNLTEGGEGVCGYLAPDWLRKLYSTQRKGTGNAMFGRNHTENSRSQISQTRKQRIVTGELIPTKHSEEWKEHLRINNAGGKAVARPIFCIDSNGTILHTYESVQQAATVITGEESGAGKTNIHSSAVRKGRILMPYGYFWRFVDDYDDKEDFRELSDRIKQHKIGKKIYQYDMDMNLIREWGSVKEAAAYCNTEASNMSHTISKGRPRNGFFWKKE